MSAYLAHIDEISPPWYMDRDPRVDKNWDWTDEPTKAYDFGTKEEAELARNSIVTAMIRKRTAAIPETLPVPPKEPGQPRRRKPAISAPPIRIEEPTEEEWVDV